MTQAGLSKEPPEALARALAAAGPPPLIAGESADAYQQMLGHLVEGSSPPTCSSTS